MTQPRFQPLGDQAVMAYFATEREALAFARSAQAAAEDWLIEVVPAYTSVAVFYDLDRIHFDEVVGRLIQLERSTPGESAPGRLHQVPCCYDFGLDTERVAEHTGLTVAEVIRLHAETIYTVCAIGFSPGFPYLGYLPRELEGVPRLDAPRLRVEPGSVGLTGRQTGIYPEARPGGWNIIGRTPLCLVNVADGYFPLRAGDRVQFIAIDKSEFQRLEGRQVQQGAHGLPSGENFGR